MGINKHTIELIDRKQLFYKPIYILGSVELEMLKTYIKTYLKMGFIWPFKSFAGVPIIFDKKLDSNFCLCVNYWSLNNLTIKNQYPFLLIRKALDWLSVMS